MYIKYEDIKNNNDGINSYTTDPYSIHQILIQIIKSTLKDQINIDLYNTLIQNNYSSASTYQLVLDQYALNLSLLLQKYSYLGSNIKIKSQWQKFQKSSDQNEVISIMKEFFQLFNLKGRTKDILVFVEDFNLFNNEQLETISKMNFLIEPVNGCDLPS